MNAALPSASVDGYKEQVPKVTLPDPDDRHVVAAGIATSDSIILTWNLRDFPTRELKKFGLRRETPDAFVSSLYDKVPDLVIDSLANARRNLTKPGLSASDFIKILKGQKLIDLAKRAQRHLTQL
jgi:hypothetical protein